jgi:hypothetical protein
MHLFQVCDHRPVRVVLIGAQSAVCREALKTVYCPPPPNNNFIAYIEYVYGYLEISG